MLRLSIDKPSLVFCVVFPIIAFFAYKFASHDTLGTFADDSVSYIIMAQSLSPYFSTPQIIVDAATAEKYPPLFPLILAITGVSHSYFLGHILVVSFFLAALIMLYTYAGNLLGNATSALLVSLLFAFSPSSWLNMLGILSENLYILLVLACLYIYERNIKGQQLTIYTALSFGLILSMVLLTRSIGVSIIAAYITTSTIRQRSLAHVFQPKQLLVYAIPLVLALLWHFLRVSSGPDLYASDVGKVANNILADGNLILNLKNWIMPQLEGLYLSWFTAFLLYWRNELSINFIFVNIFALLALAGFASRLRQNQFDAWYLMYYMLIVIVWPYSEQTGRFLYPALPLLFIYGAVGINLVIRRLPRVRNVPLLTQITLLLILATVLPTMAFFQSRAQYQTEFKDMDFSRVMLFYNHPQLAKAKQIALHHEHLRQDLELLKTTTNENDIIMWYTPNYINLLSQRKAVRFPPKLHPGDLARAIKQSGADYIFAAKLNPRYTNEKFDGLVIYPLVAPFTTVVWARQNPMGENTLSVLLKIDRKKLDRLD